MWQLLRGRSSNIFSIQNGTLPTNPLMELFRKKIISNYRWSLSSLSILNHVKEFWTTLQPQNLLKPMLSYTMETIVIPVNGLFKLCQSVCTPDSPDRTLYLKVLKKSTAGVWFLSNLFGTTNSRGQWFNCARWLGLMISNPTFRIEPPLQPVCTIVLSTRSYVFMVRAGHRSTGIWSCKRSSWSSSKQFLNSLRWGLREHMVLLNLCCPTITSNYRQGVLQDLFV